MSEEAYYLDDRVTPTGWVAGQPDPILLWHWRLGHPSLQKIRYVIFVESSISSFSRKSCELGKHHRATFQSRVNSVVVLLLSWSILAFGVLVGCPLLSVLDIFYSLLMTSLT